MQSIKISFQSIIHSSGGVHVSIYVRNNGIPEVAYSQIAESYEIAKEYLAKTMDNEAIDYFLNPIKNLLDKPQLIAKFKYNIGIFRSKDTFRLVNIPISVQHLCVVATTFHVKPLLSWLQADKDFIMVLLDREFSSLYLCNQYAVRHVDTIPYMYENKNTAEPENGIAGNKKTSSPLKQISHWLQDFVHENNQFSQVPIFFSGDKQLKNRVASKLRFPKKNKVVLAEKHLSDAILSARARLLREFGSNIKKSLVEYYWAEDLKVGTKDIHKISKAAVNGQIRKLIIAESKQIFGKINRNTGDIDIHPTHLDHEDDDILDDMAQLTMASGGEVIVVPDFQIPKGYSMLAILRAESNDNVKLDSDIVLFNENIKIKHSEVSAENWL